MHLALQLGFTGREKMYAAMTPEELHEVEALHRIDPWGEERGDLRNGILCSLLEACHSSKGQGQSSLEYMPYVKSLQGAPKQMSEEAMKEQWKRAVAMWPKG